MNAAVHYRIAAHQPAAHIFDLLLTIAKPAPDGQQLRLPNWIPGSYMIRDFSRHLGPISVRDGSGQPVALARTGKSAWQCAPAAGPLTVAYEVYAWDLSVRGAHLDQTHGFFNGTSVFLEAVGQQDLPHELSIDCPAGASGWRVATSLARAEGTPALGFGRYRAASYDELIDHPVEMGDFSHTTFLACGVPHEIVITGRHRCDLDRLARDLEKVCSAQIRFFGEPAPFDRYVFLVTAVGAGYGGLEHRASTALLCSRDDLPLATEPEAPGERYRTFLGLCSHEYFHSWNVKRIKPAVFLPYDLTTETLTPLLWAFEGFTSYYDDLFLVRAGVITPQAYLELLSQQVTRHLRTPGRLRQSVAESSLEAWTKYYKQDENSPNAIVSYYVKGALVGLCLDLLLRARSGDRVSLDTLMRRLWTEFGQAGRGVGEDEIPRLATELCGDPLTDFWTNALQGTGELPLAELLVSRGLEWLLRPAEGAADAGGKAGSGEGRPRAWLGAKTGGGEGGASLVHVFSGGPASQAGLSAGDVVIAVNGLRVTGAGLDKLLGSQAPGDRLEIHAFRRDELMQFTVILTAAPADTCVLALPADAGLREQVQRWLLGGARTTA
ncbi:MAG: peptidase domain protein [Moraxellaceae bacterium]|jgi:predicted metalloprotease with PDZ domain|nr:peptidase domain protein [Moraxellaceae bacterium]